MKCKIKQSILSKYILTYTLVFWISIAVFIGTFYYNMRENMNDRWQVEQSNKLITLQYIIDFNFQQMTHIVRKIEEVDYIKDLKLEEQIVQTLELQKELKEIKQFSPMVEEIIIAMKGNKYIYSDVTTYTTETLNSVRGMQLPSSIGQESKWKVRMVDTLNEGKKEKNVMVSYPLRLGTSKEWGTINLVLSSKELRKIIDQVTSMENKQFLILVDNALAWELNDISKRDLFYIQSLVVNKVKGEEVIQLDQQSYSLFYNTSGDTQIKYIYCADDKYKVSELAYLNKAIGVMSCLCLVLSGVIVYLLTYYNYKPLKNIKNMISEIEGEDIPEHNEFEMIENVIMQLSHENTQLDSTLEKMIEEQQSYLYYKLLRGVQDEKIEELAEQLDSEVEIGYRVLIYGLVGIQEVEIKKQKIEKVLQQVFEKRVVHIELGLERNQVICILNTNQIEEEELEQRVRLTCIESEMTLYITVGKEYMSWDKIAKSFEEAQRALNDRSLVESTQIIWYEKVTPYKGELKLPSWLVAKLRVDISKMDKESTKQDLEKIRQFISEQNLTYNIAKNLCKRVINEVIDCLDEEAKKQFYQNTNCPTEHELKQVDSMENVIQVLNKVQKSTCEVLAASEQKGIEAKESKAELYMHIMRYIKKNYMNPDLSIQEMADQNQIALPNLTTYFKKQVGQTPKDYLTYVRMKHAKELLITTKEPLNNIANESGYQNVSSFIRQFKKVEGITPGEYRKYNIKS